MATARSGLHGYLQLSLSAEHWWKVRSLRWDGERRSGFAEMEPVDELPARLAKLAE